MEYVPGAGVRHSKQQNTVISAIRIYTKFYTYIYTRTWEVREVTTEHETLARANSGGLGVTRFAILFLFGLIYGEGMF